MLKRTLSTVILWGLVVACIALFGSTGGVWLLTVIAALTLREFYGLVSKMGIRPFNRIGILLGTLMMLAPLYLEEDLGLPLRSDWLLAATVVIFSIRILGEREQDHRVETLGWSLFGVIYVPFMLHFLVRILLLDAVDEKGGLILAVWLIASSKFCDTGALLAGMAFGRHKMSPVISPKKTWEGAVGGVLVSAGISAAIAWFFQNDLLPLHFTPLIAAAMAVPIAILAIVSDLIESVIKRRANIKDTGQTIPGIGGVFDLSDSLILTAPVGWALLQLL